MLENKWAAAAGYDVWAAVSVPRPGLETQRDLLVVHNNSTHFLVLQADTFQDVNTVSELAVFSYLDTTPWTAYRAALNHLCWLISGLK